METTITITVTDLSRGFKAVVTVDGKAEDLYCGKLHEVPQAVKDALAPVFPKQSKS